MLSVGAMLVVILVVIMIVVVVVVLLLAILMMCGVVGVGAGVAVDSIVGAIFLMKPLYDSDFSR